MPPNSHSWLLNDDNRFVVGT